MTRGKNDESTTLSDLRQAVAGFIAARRWEPYHTPKNLAMSIAIEAAELMEHFQWTGNAEAQALLHEPHRFAEAADELADILIYCLSFANQTGIDISRAVLAKLERNEGRFPAVEALRRKPWE
jgi:dCTP diphosphatase